jgi:hypothetical protein
MSAAFNSRRPKKVKPISQEESDALVRQMRAERSGMENYREKSLKLHGAICAKCGREFDQHNLHLLTVHHKDGNHDDEHSRGMLVK